jgi:hypothetical protein
LIQDKELMPQDVKDPFAVYVPDDNSDSPDEEEKYASYIEAQQEADLKEAMDKSKYDGFGFNPKPEEVVDKDMSRVIEWSKKEINKEDLELNQAYEMSKREVNRADIELSQAL